MASLMRYINRTSRSAVLYRNDKLLQYGINDHQHAYIIHICQNPGISQDKLARMICVNKSNVTRQLALLEQDGFILREPGRVDQRLMQVYPTQKAADIYPKVKEVLHDWNTRLLEDFTEEEQKILVAMMEKVMNKAIALVEKNLDQEMDLL